MCTIRPLCIRLIFALSLGACTLPALALADAKQSATHAMQWVEGENIHIAGERGAINRHAEVRVEVQVFSSQRALVSDSGTRREHNLYSNYWSQDTTTWSNLWRGSWSITGDTMQLELTLTGRQCSHKKTWSDAAPQTLPCQEVAKQLQLLCQLESVKAERGVTLPAWVCSPMESTDLGETPSRWVLGKASCVKVIAGRHGPTYERCAAP